MIGFIDCESLLGNDYNEKTVKIYYNQMLHSINFLSSIDTHYDKYLQFL